MAMSALRVESGGLRYRVMIGTGGIGSGVFFLLNGNGTLGREESRGGRFLNRRDYCKLHIISHYVQTLLGPDFHTIPLGKVGDDETGARLVQEMAQASLDMRYVAPSPGDPTLYSFCIVYPDGAGGNLTTDDSASSRVARSSIRRAEPEFARWAGSGVALAVPEVPLEAREALLDLGTKHRFFRVGSFTTEELPIAVQSGLLAKLDLLALNADEAAAAAGVPQADEEAPADIVARAVRQLSSTYPALLISITAGRHGSWSWDGASLMHTPSYEARIESTAGAGDAYLSGLIVGLAARLSVVEAHQLGALVAGLSVTSPHTIDSGIGRESLRVFAAHCGAPLSCGVRRLVGE
jgi:ribokinase